MIPLLGVLANAGLSFVTELVRDKGEILVSEGVKKLTGIDLSKKQELTPDEIAKINSYKLELQKLDFEKLKLELYKKKENNRHDETIYTTAHETYRINNDMSDRIAEQIIKFNLPVIFLLVIVNIIIVHNFKDNPTLIAIVSNIIGVAMGHLFNERQAIVNFFFGSSIGSKQKTDKMLKL